MEIEKHLTEISPDAPSGEDLEYDPAFGELERAAHGKPEQQMGDEVVPAEDPNWRDVRRQSAALLERTKDLRIAMHLARASLHGGGFAEFAPVTELIHGYLEKFWDSVHPQLDPEDDNDPTMRVNIIASLCDDGTMLRAVREAPLVESKALGKYSLKDVLVASGKLAGGGDDERPDMAAIDGAFMDADLDTVQATADSIRSASDRVRLIEDELTNRVGAAQAVDLSGLRAVLDEAHGIVAEQLGRRGVGVPGLEEGDAAGSQAAQGISGEIRSREDVIRMLDKVCEYYERYEPSSPVPLLVRRAKRLTSKTFMDIVRDLAPDGVSQAELIRGSDGED